MNDHVNPNLVVLKSQKINIFDKDNVKVGTLHPLSVESMSMIEEISNHMTHWRNQSMKSFFTGFKATPERTVNWLKTSVLQSNSQILYLVYSDKKLIGQFGLANITTNAADLDNAIRGVRGGNPDLFKYIEYVLLDVAFNHLNVEKVEGKLFSNNLIAILLHKQFGFTVTDRSSLKYVENGEEWHYTPCTEKESNTKVDQLLITLTKEKFLNSTEIKKIKWEFDQLN